MSNERILADAMVLHEEWGEAAQEMQTWNWELDVQAESYGDRLVGSVALGTLSVSELRGGVCWANALDGEAVERSGGDIKALGGGDYLEALARRIAHHAGRRALNAVKNSRGRERVQRSMLGQTSGCSGSTPDLSRFGVY